jgi:hypothetical protein
MNTAEPAHIADPAWPGPGRTVNTMDMTVEEIPATELLAQILDGHDGVYLLWSGKRNAWWAAGGWGYTTDRYEAGRFSLLVAVHHVVRSAQQGDPDVVTRMVWTAA